MAVFSVVPSFARKEHYFRLRGEQYYMEGRYKQALEMFEKYESGDPYNLVFDEPYLHRKAELLYKMSEFDSALVAYELVLHTDPEQINYQFFKGLIFRSSNPTAYSHMLAVIDSVEQESYAKYSFEDTVRRFDVKPFHAINTEYSEFAAVDFKDRIYFSSITDRRFARKDVNTDLTHYDIYSVSHFLAHGVEDFEGKMYAELNKEEKKLADSLHHKMDYRYEDQLNTSFNNGPITFYNDSVAFITINQVHNKKDQGTFNLTIHNVNLTGDPNNMFTKSAIDYFGEYFSPADVGQIAFSKDQKQACMAVKLSFSSTESDLWFADRLENGLWGEPYKADDRINTDYDELFPWYSFDDYLYFSTDGQVGMGGLDIYRVDIRNPKALPHNVGLGINTPYDDFAFNVDTLGRGYLTSNRIGGRGDDDIYTLEMNYGYIKVVLLGDTAWVDNPDFDFYDFRGDKFDSVNVKTDTSYFTRRLAYGDYDFKHSFPVDSLYEKVRLYEDTVTVYVQFDKILPDTLPVSFTNFCFDCDGMDEITADKFRRMVTFLLEFPEIEVVLTGNTDMFGTHKYNDALGMRRADIMEKWLREAGVTNPVIKSTNGKRKLISKTDHRLNRRVDVELYWPGDTERIVYISDEDERLERELVIEYDAALKHDHPLVPGYYILIHRSRHYLSEDKCAERFGVPDLDVILHSEKWNLFNYYLNVPFSSAIEAQEFIEIFNLKAKVVYLE